MGTVDHGAHTYTYTATAVSSRACVRPPITQHQHQEQHQQRRACSSSSATSSYPPARRRRRRRPCPCVPLVLVCVCVGIIARASCFLIPPCVDVDVRRSRQPFPPWSTFQSRRPHPKTYRGAFPVDHASTLMVDFMTVTNVMKQIATKGGGGASVLGLVAIAYVINEMSRTHTPSAGLYGPTHQDQDMIDLHQHPGTRTGPSYDPLAANVTSLSSRQISNGNGYGNTSSSSTGVGGPNGFDAESVRRWLREGDDPNLPRKYDVGALRAHYSRKPRMVASRVMSVGGKSMRFVWQLQQDISSKRWDDNMAMRAVQLREMVADLGPAFIKVAQGLSVRPDILPSLYVNEFQQFQDRVRPFPSDLAIAILEKNLGGPIEQFFTDRKAFRAPVAAASLGQVYKAEWRLPNGRTKQVAVKVQRPDLLSRCSLDLFVIRRGLEVTMRIVPGLKKKAGSIIGVVDNAGKRFIDELDYKREAANQERFRSFVQGNALLGGSIVVPEVYNATQHVLVSEWIDGSKFSDLKEEAKDPQKRASSMLLVKALVNCYLVQLLETGFLHADPHPGNFLRTPDGRLCMLDFGLVTEIEEDQRLALVEYVAHLSAKDYNATLGDLCRLGFIPKEVYEDPQMRDDVLPLVSHLVETFHEGGTESMNIESMGRELEQLTKQYTMRVPDYFGLILRAFGTLEGLGLTVDDTFQITEECMPYLAKRLLSDNTVRVREALRSFLYGTDGVLRADRVQKLIDGYTSFTLDVTGLERDMAAAESAPSGEGGRAAANRRGQKRNERPIEVLRKSKAIEEGDPPPPPEDQEEDDADAADHIHVDEQGFAIQRKKITPIMHYYPSEHSNNDTLTAAGKGNTTTVSATRAMAGRRRPRRGGLTKQAEEMLKLVFAPEGNYMQELIVDEMVRLTDALARTVTAVPARAVRMITGLFPAPFSDKRSWLANLILLPLLPVTAPIGVVNALSSRVEQMTTLDEDDLRALLSAREVLLTILQPNTSPQVDERTRRNLMRRFVRLEALLRMQAAMSAVSPGVPNMAGQFASKLTSRVMRRTVGRLRRTGGRESEGGDVAALQQQVQGSDDGKTADERERERGRGRARQREREREGAKVS
ncbi:unnamed protein product [Vitrella brassicaformis CCMP3155]|uniref:Protein kinase domain-containing protein n=2 Tax=Vitrella brassicaformis TaxID=1169539 RepID=A0A0G4GGM9_VITBC|nr:unnamed protein product [Vitrella brassicaformis CCMP3155]|eukprot:CEM28594.1 unnamed protein product [Vitrella brassicaformis CCMP3155]